jgi:D-alanyl-D-alanine carboxypeptidase
MRLPVFASIVAAPSATLPIAGTVHNTNTLLGHNGFVGVKTGSDDAAGGCFAFRAIRWIDGKRTTITGVVLGQPGHDRIAAGLAAADAMVDRIAGHRAVPDLQQRTLAPGTAPPKPSITAARPCTPTYARLLLTQGPKRRALKTLTSGGERRIMPNALRRVADPATNGSRLSQMATVSTLLSGQPWNRPSRQSGGGKRRASSVDGNEGETRDER